MDPVICLVTGGAARPETTGLVERLRAAADAGIHLLQIRERQLEARPLFELVRAVVAAVEGTPARVIVNDRADVALAAGAHGVHLRGDSPSAARVRSLVPHGFVIGRSVRSAAEAQAAAAGGGLDYLLFGTVFATASKPGVPAAGVDALATAVSATSLPVLAIGGVTAARVVEVARSGAAGVAAISLFECDSFDRLVPGLRASFASAFKPSGDREVR